ncbi:hypothetical protein [Halochromatium roseum]|uniref:hypothetical protein n=1 Tax=Halochromatium roseum TaxID=391920 RepID=UPI0019142F26|nr:hypothetical protein [Halochromatium roseum]MBK5938240.1 hypothetical protein [Halochromatium roseum]
MSIVPPPSPVEDLIAIQLALAALIVWLVVSIERRFHRWPLITAASLLLILLVWPQPLWRALWTLAWRLQALLEDLGLLGLLALILLSVAAALGDSALRAWLQRRC